MISPVRLDPYATVRLGRCGISSAITRIIQPNTQARYALYQPATSAVLMRLRRQRQNKDIFASYIISSSRNLTKEILVRVACALPAIHFFVSPTVGGTILTHTGAQGTYSCPSLCWLLCLNLGLFLCRVVSQLALKSPAIDNL